MVDILDQLSEIIHDNISSRSQQTVRNVYQQESQRQCELDDFGEIKIGLLKVIASC
jgi:hypothetical protein